MPKLWKICFVGMVLLSACSQRYPRWDGKIYTIDPGDGSVTRPSSFERISCKAPEVSKYRCVTDLDFRSFWATYVLGCEKWRPEVPMGSGSKELNELYEAIHDLFPK